MALGTTDISVSLVKNTLGETTNNVSELCTSPNINMYSFYKPCGLQANATTKVVESVTDVSPFHLGDFRKYDHSANTPNVQPDMQVNFVPESSSVTFSMSYINSQLNLKEVDSSISNLLVKIYSNEARTIQIASKNVAINYFAVTPPVGHKNQETQQASSTQIITGITVNNPNLYSTLYAETWFSDIGETLRGRLSDHVTEITMHEYSNPTLSFSTMSWSPSPFWEQSSTCSATAVFANNIVNNNTQGDTSWNFSFIPASVWCSSGVQERVAGDVVIKYYYDGTEYTIKTVTGFYEGQNIVVTEAITGGLTNLTWDMNVQIRLYFTNLTTTYSWS